MKNAMHALFTNTAAHAQDTCAASACSALNSILVIILDSGLLLGSIFVLLINSIRQMAVRHFPSPQAG